jgi:hypothetical protein
MAEQLVGKYLDKGGGSNKGWCKLPREGPHDFCSMLDIILMIKRRTVMCTGHVARVGEKINVYKMSLKGLMCGPRREWEDAIKMDINELVSYGVD